MFVGMHQNFDGFENALIEANQHGFNTFQIFIRNNRNMKQRQFTSGDINYFNDIVGNYPKTKMVIHAPYVMNPASCDEEKRSRSEDLIIQDLKLLKHFNIEKYMVIHPGSSTDWTYEQSMEAFRKTIDNIAPYADSTVICFETMAGQGTQLLSELDQIGWYLQMVDNYPNMSMCIDTCHLFGAGMQMKEVLGMVSILGKPKDLGVLHVNNSLKRFNSRVDRHANLTTGLIEYKRLLDDIKLVLDKQPEIPIILETPEGHLLDDTVMLKRDLSL